MSSSRLWRRTAPVLVLLLVVGAALFASCSSGSLRTSATTSSTARTITSAPASSTTSSSSAPAGPTTSSTSAANGTLVPQTPTGTEFLSPSKNISCEIDYNFGTSSTTSTLCLTLSPAKSVTLMTDGTLTECTGMQCLSNAGENTPTLQYGQSITLGPFTCASSTSGVKCTLGNGDGFVISTAGVAALGNAKVATS